MECTVSRIQPRHRTLTVLAGTAVLAAGSLLTPPAAAGDTQPAAASAADTAGTDPVELVNTFIGTQDEGNTFPGASAPFGMTQVSPIGSHYAGWRYTDRKIKGFGHNFLSGAGCWEQGGQVSVLPTVGAVGPGAAFDTTKPATFNHNNYAASYTHEGEVGQAGYYRTRLTSYGGITAEATASTRASTERYTFPASTAANVFINAGQVTDLHNVTASQARIVDNRTVVGEVRTQSFCGGRQYSTWFTMKFNRPFTSHGSWSPTGGTVGGTDSGRGSGLRGTWVSFDTSSNQQVEVTTAISKVDPAGATGNLTSEATTAGGALRSFDEARQRAQQQWRAELNRIRVTGGNRDDQTVFTTALYHALLQPLTGSDADGRYRGYDDQIHRAVGWTYREYFSLWDTYRAQNQLLALLRPSVATDVARSVLTINEQGGWLPRWGYANFETNVMTGDPVTPFLVDLWRYGALKGMEQQAYQALRRNVDGVPPADSPFSGRAGNPRYLQSGFVQHDPNFPKKGMDVDPAHGASATLEYALADCSLSVMAGELGQTGDAARLARRGGNWSEVWDPTAQSRGFTGFPRPKRDDGQWYDRVANPTSDQGFHEGTGWQYQWLAQQDVPGLTAAMGGRQATLDRLDEFFDMPTLLADPAKAARESWVIGPYSYYNVYRYNPNNEPDLHAGSMYTYLGQPAKTSAVYRAAKTLFTNAPNGVTGNDDLGTMSAWYLFTAMGLYPGVPGTGQLLLSAPQFERVDITLENGSQLTISAPGADPSALQYVAAAKLNRAPRNQTWVNWSQLARGAQLSFTLTDDRGTSWGQRTARPASPCAGQGSIG
nr:GH92 family glycosyl hydrolase [Nakamurella aerolata]